MTREERHWRDTAEMFPPRLLQEAEQALRRGDDVETVAADLVLPREAVLHIQYLLHRKPKHRDNWRQKHRPDWSLYDLDVVSTARHLGFSGADAATIASQTGLPLEVCAYIVKRAAYHARQRERRVVQATPAPAG